jgi:hypothetical protein
MASAVVACRPILAASMLDAWLVGGTACLPDDDRVNI